MMADVWVAECGKVRGEVSDWVHAGEGGRC